MSGQSSSNVLTYEGMEYYTSKLLSNIKAMLDAGDVVPPGGIIMYSGTSMTSLLGGIFATVKMEPRIFVTGS